MISEAQWLNLLALQTAGEPVDMEAIGRLEALLLKAYQTGAHEKVIARISARIDKHLHRVTA